MQFSPGTPVDPYELVGAIGGDLAEVYRARAPRLDRTAAFLPELLPAEPARVRFERESRALERELAGRGGQAVIRQMEMPC